MSPCWQETVPLASQLTMYWPVQQDPFIIVVIAQLWLLVNILRTYWQKSGIKWSSYPLIVCILETSSQNSSTTSTMVSRIEWKIFIKHFLIPKWLEMSENQSWTVHCALINKVVRMTWWMVDVWKTVPYYDIIFLRNCEYLIFGTCV